MKYGCALFVLTIAQFASAVPIDAIHTKYITPYVPRGGVLMVPLVSETPGNDWPSSIDVILESGQVVQGHVGWVEQNKNSLLFWASNPFSIREIRSSDDTSTIHPKDTTTGPVLLAQLPNLVDGTLLLGEDALDPIWLELPDTLPNLNLEPINTSTTVLPSKYALPRTNALEYWRETLIASRKGVLPRVKHWHSEIESLAAMHASQLWSIALDRLSKSSRGAAAECRDLLTNTAFDGKVEFACWSTKAEARLLSLLLDMNTTSRQLAIRSLRWCEEQQPFIYWMEQVYGDEIIVAVANPTLVELLVAIQWKEGNDIPLVIEIPPKETMRIPIRRIQTVDLSIFGPTTLESKVEWIELQIGKHAFAIPIVPPTVIAKPPGVQLQPLYPSWTLHSIQSQVPILESQNRKTVVQLRKLFGKWEFFVTCSGNSKQNHVGGEVVEFSNPILKDQISVSPIGHTTIETSWSVSVQVPEEWIVDNVLRFSVIRRHGSSTVVEEGPIPSVPWRSTYPAPIVIDLSQWDLIEQFPNPK